MASNLTFTSAPFLQGLTASAANSTTNTRYTILTADATYDRRVYGISIVNTSAASAQTVTIWLNDGTVHYQAFVVSVPLSSGNTVVGAAVLQKQRDANGVPYFNLPKTWSIQYQYNTALSTSALYVLVFGETYA